MLRNNASNFCFDVTNKSKKQKKPVSEPNQSRFVAGLFALWFLATTHRKKQLAAMLETDEPFCLWILQTSLNGNYPYNVKNKN